MVKERLMSFLGGLEIPASFACYNELLSAEVLLFPDDAEIPTEPNIAYEQGWDTQFRLPQSPVGVEDSSSLIILKDTKPDACGLDEERAFLFVLPLPRQLFPVDFYLAWGVCRVNFDTSSNRMVTGIAEEGHWFVGEPGSEFSDGVELVSAMEKCDAMTGRGVTTAFEQLVYLAHN